MKWILWLALLVPLAAAQISPNQIATNLDDDASSWTVCLLPACDPGGLNPATSGKVASGWSPRDAHSLKVSLTGPGWSNALFYRTLSATTANYFLLDLWFYVTAADLARTHALEYDAFAYNAPYRFMFGSQCVLGGNWWGWNDLTGKWIDLGFPCEVTTGRWHHLTWWLHRSYSENCSGMPCSHQDVLAIDNVYHTVNLATPASWLPTNWKNASGVNVQLDLGSTGGTIAESVDGVVLAEAGQ